MIRSALALVSGLFLTSLSVNAQVIDEYSGQETYTRFCAEPATAKAAPVTVRLQ